METINCTFTDISGNSTHGQAELATLSSAERFSRAAKKGGVFFAIALVCILVPMLHFVLVPGFLIVAIVFFTKTMSEHQLIRSADGPCPACKEKIHFNGPINAKGSKEICPNCRTLVTMSPVPLKIV